MATLRILNPAPHGSISSNQIKRDRNRKPPHEEINRSLDQEGNGNSQKPDRVTDLDLHG